MKPKSFKDVLPLVNTIYARHGTGCCLHIVTDDGNTEDYHVQWALNNAKAHNHTDCIEALTQLLDMSQTQRRQVMYRRWQ